MDYLSRISGPQDTHGFSERELGLLAGEIRELILSCVSEVGGHLAPSLGTVELTVALHSMLDSPRDKIIWDVGHQCYAHKILTGRAAEFATIRQYGGLSGFPCRLESEHDIIGTGHASTSISYGLGLVEAAKLAGESSVTVRSPGAWPSRR
jgi:1-deoxy-D-xylulose-5-phosphate synthase